MTRLPIASTLLSMVKDVSSANWAIIVVVPMQNDYSKYPIGHRSLDHVIKHLSHNQNQIRGQGTSLPDPSSNIKVL